MGCAAKATLARRSEVAVRGTTTILRVFKENAAQFVHQKSRPPIRKVREEGPTGHLIRGPHRPFAGLQGR
jgi:hypothetical protein